MADTTTPKSYIYGIIIAMFFIIGGVSILTQFNTSDPTFDSSGRTGEFNRTFNQMNNIQGQVSNLKTNIENANSDWGTLGILNALISSSWQSLRILSSSFSFMDSVYNGLGAMFGIPAWATLTISLLIIVMISFYIYQLIFRVNWQ